MAAKNEMKKNPINDNNAIITYYDNGNMASRIEKNALYQEEIHWREDGQETMYKREDKNYIEEREYEFFENGHVKQISYKTNASVIETEEFYENGQLKAFKNRNGERREYYPNGQLAYRQFGKNSKYEIGSYEKYYENGVLQHGIHYIKINGGRVKEWEEKNQKDGTPIYYFHYEKDPNVDLKQIERKYNEKGTLIYENKKTDAGWAYETRWYLSNGKLHRLEASRDVAYEKYGRKYFYEQEFDDQERLIKENNIHEGTISQITYDGTKKTVTLTGDLPTRYLRDEIILGNGTIISQYDHDQLQYSVTKDKNDHIIGEHFIEYDSKGNKRSDDEYLKDNAGHMHKKKTLYHENGQIAEIYQLGKDGYKIQQYNSEGEMIYTREGSQEGMISHMQEYNKPGKILLRSIETLSTNQLKYTEYGNTETEETIKDSNGNVISKTVITYHDDKKQKIATLQTVFPNSLAKLTMAYNEQGVKTFEQKVDSSGQLLELYETYPNGTRKHHITTHKDGIREERYWNKNDIETFYQKLDSENNLLSQNQTFYVSGRVDSEIVEDGVIKYWDTDRHNISQKIDTNGKIVYEEYENGQKKYEVFADGSSTKWYETGEVLCQKDKKGNQEFFHKNGEQRLTIKANGHKHAEYGPEQYLLISGRHCYRQGDGLAKIGEEQAANIGKFLAYATQGKIAGLPNIIVPEVCSFDDTPRCVETTNLIIQNMNDVLHTNAECATVEGSIDKCVHTANSELSIHGLGPYFDLADQQMGSIAFSVIGRDGLVVDRVVFNAEQIARQIEKVETHTKALEQTISEKLDKIGIKIQNGDAPHAKTKILREIGKDNLGKPKRNEADKNIIKSVINKTMTNKR